MGIRQKTPNLKPRQINQLYSNHKNANYTSKSPYSFHAYCKKSTEL